MGSLCLFTCQQALKMRYFYWLRVKNSNHLHTELNLGYLKGTKFCLESKASFIDISSIASFKPFLIAWLRHYFSFSDSSVVNLKSSHWPRYTQLGTIFQKKNHVLLSNFFSSSNMFFITLFLANTWRKNRGSPCSFKRKWAFILLSSLVWGKSLTLCTCTRPCARADDAKSCAVEMRNAILRNYLIKIWLSLNFIGRAHVRFACFCGKMCDSGFSGLRLRC